MVVVRLLWDGMGLMKLEKRRRGGERRDKRNGKNGRNKRDMRALVLVLLEWYYWSGTIGVVRDLHKCGSCQ